LPHLWPTGSSWVSPSIAARYFSSCPSDPTSRWTPCPPEYRERPSGQRGYEPRFWIWHPSFERQRDFNPPEQRAAQRALRTFLTEKYEQLQEYKKQNPNLSRENIAQYIAKNRAAGREKIEKFLTPEQLKIWDAEVAKAKDFLSQRAASA